MTSRIDKITQTIEDYAENSWQDGYHTGMDEAWDEAKNKGYDEGWDDCKVHMDKQEAYDKTSAYDNGWNDATEGHTAAKSASWDAGYVAGGADWQPRMDSQFTAGYDEGFDTAMTNFEADERVNDLRQEAYDNGYTCGIRNGTAELMNKLKVFARKNDKTLINIDHIREAAIEISEAHPLMKDKKG